LPTDSPLEFIWTVPDGLRIIEKKGALLKLASDAAGRWTVTLRVKNSDGTLSPPAQCEVASCISPRRPVISVPSEIRARLNALPPPSVQGSAPRLDSGLGGEYRTGETVLLDASGSRSPDGDAFSVRWEQLDGPEKISSFKATGTNDAVWAFEAKTPGVYAFRPNATVGDLTTSGEPVVIRILPADDAPVADAGPDRVAFRNDVVQLDGRASGVSPKTGVFLWSQISGPSAPRMLIGDSAEDQAAPRFIFPDCGDYVFSLTVVDSSGRRSAPDDVLISVIPENRPPLIKADAVAYCELGDSLELTAIATDPDHDALDVQWLFIDGPMKTAKGRMLSETRTYGFRPDEPGHYRFRAVATDIWRARADALVSVYVPPRDFALPASVIAGDRVVSSGGETQLTLQFVADPAAALFFDWRVVSGDAIIASSNWKQFIVIRAPDGAQPDSSVVVSVSVSDGARVLTIQTATIRVLPPADVTP